LKIKYDAREDILTYEIAKDPIDYAEEMDSIIVHFTEDGKPVLLEILDASKFLAETIKAAKGLPVTQIQRARSSIKD